MIWSTSDLPTEVYIAVPAGVAIALVSLIGWIIFKNRGGKGDPPPGGPPS